MSYPSLYTSGWKRKLFTKKLMSISTATAEAKLRKIFACVAAYGSIDRLGLTRRFWRIALLYNLFQRFSVEAYAQQS